ncbi:MAG TPA: hypothetical protein VHB98_12195 [Chloroflexota bacterium]|nr:hypothetical protein [Chloroflexota bacterium]
MVSTVIATWIGAFALSLAVVLFASDRLVAAVEAAGDRYHWPPGLVGLLAAAGADGPEVTSAFLALAAGSRSVGLGVILGSNLFNLAALLGLPVVLVGYVAIQRSSLLLSGGAMLLTTLCGAVLILGYGPIFIPETVVLLALVTYAVLLVKSSARASLAPPESGQTAPSPAGAGAVSPLSGGASDARADDLTSSTA